MGEYLQSEPIITLHCLEVDSGILFSANLYSLFREPLLITVKAIANLKPEPVYPRNCLISNPMTSRRSILLLLGVCQLFCAIALVDPRTVYFVIALIAFVLGLLESATTDETSVLTIVFIILSVLALSFATYVLYIEPEKYFPG